MSKKLRCFLKKFTQLTKILHDRRSRQIPSLCTASPTILTTKCTSRCTWWTWRPRPLPRLQPSTIPGRHSSQSGFRWTWHSCLQDQEVQPCLAIHINPNKLRRFCPPAGGELRTGSPSNGSNSSSCIFRPSRSGYRRPVLQVLASPSNILIFVILNYEVNIFRAEAINILYNQLSLKFGK